MIEVILDDIVITKPNSWKELSSKLKREDGYNAVLLYQETNLELTDEGYNYLYSKLLSDGFCAVIKCEIRETCNEGNTYDQLIVGKIFLSDVKFNEKSCTANVKLEDQSFFAMIKNNLKIKTTVDARKSKNQLDISSYLPPDYLVDYYDVATNASVVKANVYTVRVYDAFKYMIAFITDGRVGFESTLFNVGGKWDGLAITTGKRIYSGSKENWQQFSMQDLFTEVSNCTEPLLMILEDPYTNPVIRIESLEYTYSSNIIMTIDDIYEVTTSVETDQIYTNVKVGTDILNDDQALPFPEQINLFGFKKEEVYLVGECNIDNDLDLNGTWVRSNNVIEDIIYLNSENYNENIFFVETIRTSNTTGRTTNENIFNISPAVYYYNTGLTNDNILERYIGKFPNSVAQLIGDTQDGLFQAVDYSGTIPYTVNEFQLDYGNEVYDFGNDYDAFTSTFTAPLAGIYSFKASVNFNNFTWSASSQSLGIELILKYFDSGGNPTSNVVLDTKYADNFPPIPTPYAYLAGTRTQKMNQGDYVQVWVRLFNVLSSFVSFDKVSPGTFVCYDNSLGGGIIINKDPKNYPILLHEFEYPLNTTQWENIINNPLGRIQFKMNKQPYRNAWIKEIKYQHITKIAKFKLITSSNAD
jgi:hypothetical protein